MPMTTRERTVNLRMQRLKMRMWIGACCLALMRVLAYRTCVSENGAEWDGAVYDMILMQCSHE